METSIQAAPSAQPGKPSLHTLIGQLITRYIPAAKHNQNHFRNEVPYELPVAVNEEMLLSILDGVLSAVISQARNSLIRVLAKTYGDVVLIHVKDHNSYNSYAVASGLARVQALAERMGGYLDITSQRQKEMTIAFSFPNLCAA